MRTVKVSRTLTVTDDDILCVETEVIVDDDESAEEAGAQAQAFLFRFIHGMVEEAGRSR